MTWVNKMNLPQYPFNWSEFHKWKNTLPSARPGNLRFWIDEFRQIPQGAWDKLSIIQRPR